MTRAEAIAKTRAACDALAELEIPDGIEFCALTCRGTGVHVQLWSPGHAACDYVWSFHGATEPAKSFYDGHRIREVSATLPAFELFATLLEKEAP